MLETENSYQAINTEQIEHTKLSEVLARASLLKHEMGLAMQALMGANASFGLHLAYLSEMRVVMYDQFWAELGKIFVGTDGIHTVRDSLGLKIEAEGQALRDRISEKVQGFKDILSNELSKALSEIQDAKSGSTSAGVRDPETTRFANDPVPTCQ